MIIQQIYWTFFFIIRFAISLLVQIHEDKQIQVFFKKINLVRKLEQDGGATVFLLLKNKQYFKLFFRFIKYNRII